MRRVRLRPAGRALVLFGALVLAPGCHGRPRLTKDASQAAPTAASPGRNHATEGPRAALQPPARPVSRKPSERRAAPEGDPFGRWMVEVLVLDENGQPLPSARVQTVRGGAATNRAGRAWLPPLGVDLGRPSADHRYKTLVVTAQGHAPERRWVGDEQGSLHVFRLRQEP